MELILIDKGGRERSRVLLLARKMYGDLAKVYIRFNAPADIDGTAFLGWENREGPDDQYLYLPSLRRVRRIVSSQKDRSFVNSDYTYEDLEKRKVGKDTHTILRSESVGKHDCWVLESVPQGTSESQYGKLVSWIAKDIYVPVKIEFYDSRNTLFKRLMANEIKKFDGIWTVTESEQRTAFTAAITRRTAPRSCRRNRKPSGITAYLLKWNRAPPLTTVRSAHARLQHKSERGTVKS